jgi:V8-like Glu-specific endopeptidase
VPKIFGPDDRTQVIDTTQFPWSATGIVEAKYSNGDLRTGTGAMIGNKTVLTVAHVVYDATLGWANVVYFIPGKNGMAEPFGQIQAAQSMALDGWIKNHNDDFDIAILVLNTAVGQKTGYFKIEVESNTFFNDQFMTSSGYPGDLGSIYQYWGTGSSYGLRGNLILHSIDTEPGQSGAPMWIGSVSDNSIRLVGLMKGTMETTIAGQVTEDGLGTRITQEFANWIDEQLVAQKDVAQEITGPVNAGVCSGAGAAGVFLVGMAMVWGAGLNKS